MTASPPPPQKPDWVKNRLRAESFNVSEVALGFSSPMLRYRLRSQGIGFSCVAEANVTLSVLEAVRIGKTRHLTLLASGLTKANLKGLVGPVDIALVPEQGFLGTLLSPLLPETVAKGAVASAVASVGSNNSSSGPVEVSKLGGGSGAVTVLHARELRALAGEL